MPLFVHKRQSPSGGLLFGGVDQGALSTFFTSSTAHCSLDSRVRENVSVEIGPEFLSWSPIFTASRLPKSMNLLSSCIIFNLLCFCRPLRSGHEAGYLRPSDDSQISWRAHTRVSHAPCGEAWAPNTCASGSALSRMTQGSVWVFPVVLAAARRRTPHTSRQGRGGTTLDASNVVCFSAHGNTRTEHRHQRKRGQAASKGEEERWSCTTCLSSLEETETREHPSPRERRA